MASKVYCVIKIRNQKLSITSFKIQKKEITDKNNIEVAASGTIDKAEASTFQHSKDYR